MSYHFFILSSNHWNFTWQSSQSIAAELANRGHRVTYIEPIPKRWTNRKEIRRVLARILGTDLGGGTVPQRKKPNVTVRSIIALPDVGAFAQWLNRSILIPLAARKLLRENSSGETIVVINQLPIPASLALQHKLGPNFSIYLCMWDWCHDPHVGQVEFESQLLKAVDLVVADSPKNIARARKQHNNILVIPGGVDLDVFLKEKYPPKPPTQNPLCIYFGSIGKNINTNLLAQVSQRYRLRLVGPWNNGETALSPQTEMVGPVPYEEVPKHLADADVILFPYDSAPHTEAILPAKLFESLITGKPIVAINLPSLEPFQEIIYLAKNEVDFLDKIGQAQLESPALREKRIKIAQDNTWEKHTENLDKAIASMLAHKGKSQIPESLIVEKRT